MTVRRQDVLDAARRVFPDRDPIVIMAILDGYGTHPHEPERARVQLAILELCEGQESKLGHFVGTAKHDYRDVLHWAASPRSPWVGASILDVLRANWAWALLEPRRVIAQNHFGNVLVELADGSIWRVYPEDLEATKVAESAADVARLMADEEFQTDWSVEAWVSAAESSLGPLAEGQCYGFKVWPVLGGEYSTENMVMKSLPEWLAVSGDVGRQASRA